MRAIVCKIHNRLRHFDLYYFQHLIPIPDTNYYYLPIEKNACSTVKSAIYLKKYGRVYKGDIHEYWDSYRSHFKINRNIERRKTVAIIRNPVDRFWSGYQDLVAKRQWAVDCFPNRQPDLVFFLDHFDLFMKHRGLKLHFSSQSVYINRTTKKFRFEKIEEFFRYYELRSDLNENISPPSKDREFMRDVVETFVSKRYAKDVELYNESA